MLPQPDVLREKRSADLVKKRKQRKMANRIRGQAEVFCFENRDEKKLKITHNFWYDLAPIVRRPKTATSILLFFSKPIDRKEIMRRIEYGFKDLME